MIALCIASPITVTADEMRTARFDARRVFGQYQHTKDASAQHSKQDGPVYPVIEKLIDKGKTQKARVEELTASVNAAAGETRERLQLQLDVATLAVENSDLRLRLESMRIEQGLKEKAQNQRGMIIGEIWSAAARLATERGFFIVVPEGLPADGPFLSVVVTSKAEDVTEALLSNLNKEYAAKVSK
jgi:hypothetical protein